MQARLVIRDEHYAIATQLKEATQLASLTEVIGVLLTRYGRHLRETWELNPELIGESSPSPALSAAAQLAPPPIRTPINEGHDLPPLEF